MFRGIPSSVGTIIAPNWANVDTIILKKQATVWYYEELLVKNYGYAQYSNGLIIVRNGFV